MNYSEEDVRLMKNAYAAAESVEARKACVVGLAKKLNKPEKSIISKLAKEGVYIPAIRVSKVTKGKPKTKEELTKQISAQLDPEGVESPDWLVGLEKAPKLVLLRLLENICVN